MKHLHQTTRTNCGQTCVAMVAGVSIDEATRAVGKRGRTAGPDLIRGLRALGVCCTSKLIRKRQDTLWPSAAIMKVKYTWRNKVMWHWIVRAEGKIWDPTLNFPAFYLSAGDWETVKIISYIAVIPKEG